jgi:hypothetical protein
MPIQKKFPYLFYDVAAWENDQAVFVAGDNLNKKNPTTALLWLRDLLKGGFADVIGTSVTLSKRPTFNFIYLGRNGEIIRWEKGHKPKLEYIDNSEFNPEDYGSMMEIRTIDDVAYAVGMRRTAYRHLGGDSWHRIDEDVRIDKFTETDHGFTSIDGFSEKDIYTCGTNGKIFHYDGSKWTEIESPTNLILNRIVCGKNDDVYICGQLGLILRGNKSGFNVIDHGVTKDQFWGATFFKEHVYFSTMSGLYRIEDSGDLLPIDVTKNSEIPLDGVKNFYKLDANAETIWSAGERMVIYSHDGEAWQEIDYTLAT